jgi:hypothetical protein
MPDSQSCRMSLTVLLPPMNLRRSTVDLDFACFSSMTGCGSPETYPQAATGSQRHFSLVKVSLSDKAIIGHMPAN